jgi:hypothetical protein
MSEWDHRQSQPLHSVPVHRVRRKVTNRQIVVLIVLTMAICAVSVWLIWREKPVAPSAGGRPIAAAAPTSKPGTAVPTPKPAPVATAMPTDGTYLVGRHIKPGTYTSPGAATSLCYWARLRDTTGEPAAVITASYTHGRQIITIGKSDRAFVTDGCGPWELMKP